jgi:hypothetical protein
VAGPRGSTSTASGRVYTWAPTGEQFRSVTTLIGDGVPKPALVKWAPKMAAQFVVDNYERLEPLLKSNDPADQIEVLDTIKNAPWRDRDAAANKGTLVHDWAERISLGVATPDEVPLLIRGHVRAFRQFLDDFKPEYEATEMTVYSRKHKYAGTLDFIARLPGLGLCLGDYKTNRSGIFGDVALQLSAYRFADFIGLPNDTEEPMLQVDNCVAIHIAEDGYKVIPVKADLDVHKFFLHATKVAQWSNDLSKTVLSDPVRPAA